MNPPKRLITRTSMAVLLATIGVLALGGTWAVADPGNGNGTATGRPADGTVGNADNQNPPGQSPNDPNHGYECDSNHGVGQGNPAHTGCTTTTAQPTTTEAPHSTTTVAEGHKTTTTMTPTTVKPETVTTVGQHGVTVPNAQVLGTTQTRQAAALARTGTNVNALGFLVLALFALGASALLFSHRQHV